MLLRNLISRHLIFLINVQNVLLANTCNDVIIKLHDKNFLKQTIYQLLIFVVSLINLTLYIIINAILFYIK